MRNVMTKLACGVSGVALAIVLSAPVIAASNGNGAPPGAHYNLNIIGVEKGKNPQMTGSNRHSLFVQLVSTKSNIWSVPNFFDWDTTVQTQIVDTPIWLVPGDDFQVCDGNGFDPAYACDGSYLGDWSGVLVDMDGDGTVEPVITQTRNGAVFQLPCNTNINGQYWDSNGNGIVGDAGDAQLDHLVSCTQGIDENGDIVTIDPEDQPPMANYAVYARALGSPKGDPNVTITTCATVKNPETLQDELQCSLENTVQTRTKGKSTFVEVTDQLTSIVVGYCTDEIVDGDCVNQIGTDPITGDPIYEPGNVDYYRIALFAGGTQDWFWNYDNNGVRLLQLRFYDVPLPAA